ncbi:Gamma-aminobutyric acid (GABA) B receptor [Seminavis robusta]|uniref:Gamma-aminobutyric acid (GABA) B receptor n=1 Tax=Seminavis robusta TaxID=568900 RepID=A0A9N8HR90_9STRA|nr:Gamma-aminobutyric acid (GABA) B receptor [Seminavis robusta]|eukprot:Sro1055_g236060.1 Gamma-aminobutyric acid (GABA) B receptor (859) ;mRNA; f:17749-20325
MEATPSYIDRVIRGQDEGTSATCNSSEYMRQGHLLALNGYTTLQQTYNATTGSSSTKRRRRIDDKFMGITVSAFLAWHDFEERRGHVLPHLPQLIGDDCDFHWTLEIRDPKFSQAEAIRQALAATVHSSSTNPFAVVGPLFSSVTKTVNTVLGGGLGVAQISGEAMSDSLNSAPLFARTIPNTQVQAEATMAYLVGQLGVTRIASLFYVDDTYGVEFDANLNRAAKQYAIDAQHNNQGISTVTILRFAILRSKPNNGILETLLDLQQSQVRYIVAALEDVDYAPVVKQAHQLGIMGLGQSEDYAWFFQGFSDWTDPVFGHKDPALAKALHGVGIVYLHLEQNIALNTAMKRFQEAPALQQMLIARTKEPEQFQNYTFPANKFLQQYQYYTYDAVIALGLAACQTPGNFTGEQLHQQLLQLEFDGVSGHVSFDPITGTRTANSSMVHISNLILSNDNSSRNRIGGSKYYYDSRVVAVVTGGNISLQTDNPFVYASNSTIPPDVYPPMTNHNYNLIPTSLQIVGLAIAAMIVLLSLGFMTWTIRNRTKFVLTAAQPVFLVQLCLGTLVMATSIVPMSFQGETSTPALNVACMSIPWLWIVGFVMALSAIVSKTWRLEQLMEGARELRRVQVQPGDVLKPFAMLLVWCVSMLIGWTLVAPNTYQRIFLHGYDEFGRTTSSYGTCTSTDPKLAFIFQVLIGLGNFVGILFASFECYKVRDESTYYSEARSLGWSMASLLETAIVFSPLLIAMRSNPSAYFVSMAVMVAIICLSFLLPIFVPKIQRRGASYQDAKEDERRTKELNNLLLSLESGADLFADDVSVGSRRGTMHLVRHDSDAGSHCSSKRSHKSLPFVRPGPVVR